MKCAKILGDFRRNSKCHSFVYYELNSKWCIPSYLYLLQKQYKLSYLSLNINVSTLSKPSYLVWLPYLYILKWYQWGIQMHISQTNEEIMFFKNVFPCGEMYSKTSMTKIFSFK